MRVFRDLDLAEEAFAEACLRAVRRWPETGAPDDPLSWLLTVGRNAGRDMIRRRRSPIDDPTLQTTDDPADPDEALDRGNLRDDVLRLMFICCHPSLKRQDQLALALRIVAGLSVAEIAAAFLVKPKTMEQRLTRAKRLIAEAETPFETPTLMERHRRLNDVSMMVYLLFNEGWSANSGASIIKVDLCEEAIRLARLLLALFPAMAETMGLLSLLLFQDARRGARTGEDGLAVPLERQDRRLWNTTTIDEASALLQKARRHHAPGPFQLQAEIAQRHATAPSCAETDWSGIATLYGHLYALQQSPVIRLNQAAAVAEASGPESALKLLDPLAEELDRYRWFHGARAAFLEQLGRPADAHAALSRILDLDPLKSERAAVLERMALLSQKK